MKEELWLIWKEPKSRRRYKVASLIKTNNKYIFKYLKPEVEEARNNGFKFFPGFDDIDKIYENEKLFANIKTRLPNKTRPDYLEILNSYNLEDDSDDFTILRATRGRCITDSYEFVPIFNKVKVEFDVAGTRHCPDITKCKELLKINKKLYLEHDPNNLQDENAIKIIFKENNISYHLGYVPRYYSKELLIELQKGIDYSAMIQGLNFESEINDEDITAKVKLIFDIN